MKKKIFAVILSFCMLCTQFCAFAQETESDSETEISSESQLTLEDIREMQQSFAEDMESVSMNMNLNMDVTVDSGSENTPNSSTQFAFQGKYAAQMILDPMQLKIDGVQTLSLSGFSMDINTESYVVVSEEDRLMDLYTQASDGSSDTEWVHQQMDLSQTFEALGISSFDELKDLSAENLPLGDIAIDWDLTDEGDSCTLSTVLHFSDFMPLVENALSSQPTGDEIPTEMIQAILESLVANLSTSVDKTTGATLSMHMDMNESNMDALNSLIAGMTAQYGEEAGASSMPQIKLTLNDLSVDCTYTYNNVDEIIIPADALTTGIYSPDIPDTTDGATEDATEDASQVLSLSMHHGCDPHAESNMAVHHHGYHG